MLRAGHYWVPHWYKAAHNVAFWDKFGRPARETEVRARHHPTPGGTMPKRLRSSSPTELTDGLGKRSTMANYLLKRVLLIIPTMFGIMLISFAIIQLRRADRSSG